MDEAPPSVAQLKAECHRLIDQVARRPGGVKWLLGVRQQLMLFAGYKQGRQPIVTRRRNDKPG